MDPHVAAWEGDLETLRLLLSEDANVVHARDEEEFGDGNTPLHYAAYQGHLAIARLLLDGGARINEENKGGCTPLFYASQQGQSAVVNLLLDRGGRAEVCESRMGLSAVDVAATSRVLALFEQGSSSRIRRRYQRPSRPSAAPSLSCRPSGKVVVTWAEEPGLSVLPVTGYVTRIYEEGSQTPTVEARGRERKQEFTTLPPGFRAVATVAVENGLGEGEESAPSLPVRVHCRPLRPPAPPVVADNLGAVEIAWANELSLEETGAHPVTEWRLQLRSRDAVVSEWSEPGAVQTTVVQGVKPGFSYQIRLSIVTPAGQGPWSDPLLLSAGFVVDEEDEEDEAGLERPSTIPELPDEGSEGRGRRDEEGTEDDEGEGEGEGREEGVEEEGGSASGEGTEGFAVQRLTESQRAELLRELNDGV